jgi:hypothetical protein
MRFSLTLSTLVAIAILTQLACSRKPVVVTERKTATDTKTSISGDEKSPLTDDRKIGNKPIMPPVNPGNNGLYDLDWDGASDRFLDAGATPN